MLRVIVGCSQTDHHDDEKEENHDRAGVDDNLNGSQEGCSVHEVEDGQSEHDADHANRTVDGFLEEEHAQGAGNHEHCHAAKEDRLPR